jgi:histidyl-tRNA synthetase
MGISTTPPSGFRDFLPDEVAARNRVIRLITSTYQKFGFQPIATPAAENLEVLLGKGGGDNEKLIFKILKRGEKQDVVSALSHLFSVMAKRSPEIQQTSNSDSIELFDRLDAIRTRHQNEVAPQEIADLGLRFDLTLPLARYYSKYGSQLPHPFKAFNLGPVWRAERTQKGRFREFLQCDVDIIGSESWGAEVEVISAILTVFKALEIEDVEVVLNDRTYVYAALEHAGVPESKKTATCIIIDKLDKLPREKVIEELIDLIGNNCVSHLQQTLLVTAPNDGATLDPGIFSAQYFSKLRQIASAVAKNVNSRVRIDPSLMRGFDYYTGPVFEFRHPSLSGSLGGGGRYDKLTAKFGGALTPACGGSIGFERLMLILEEKRTNIDLSAPDAVVTVFSDDMREKSLETGAALRGKGLSIDVYPGTGKLKAQFKYADQKKAGYAIVIGPDEAAKGVMNIKALATGVEQSLTLEEACALIAGKH